MSKYIYRNDDYEEKLDATSWQDAIEDVTRHLKEIEYGTIERTIWSSVGLAEEDENGDVIQEIEITIPIHPAEPDCRDLIHQFTPEDSIHYNHEWQSPYSVVGGIESNPGVEGHAGGVLITEVCKFCGVYRVRDTWAQNPETGEQGLESVEYRPADKSSLLWIATVQFDELNVDYEKKDDCLIVDVSRECEYIKDWDNLKTSDLEIALRGIIEDDEYYSLSVLAPGKICIKVFEF
jgi:hypothetical protein